MHTHRHTHRTHSLFFTQSLFLLSLSSSFSASEKSWHRLGLGDVLRPLLTLCQLCYTLVGVHLSFPICFCSHYLAPGQAPCLKYTRALVHMRTHTSFIFVLMTQFYNCVKPTHGIAGVLFFFSSLPSFSFSKEQAKSRGSAGLWRVGAANFLWALLDHGLVIPGGWASGAARMEKIPAKASAGAELASTFTRTKRLWYLRRVKKNTKPCVFKQ